MTGGFSAASPPRQQRTDPGSELEPQRELNLAAVSGRNRIGNGPCRRADVIAARENNQIGMTKVRVIERVEDLRPKLQIQSLFQRNPFEQRSIYVPHARSSKLVAPHVPKGSGRRRKEGVRIEISAGLLEPVHTQNHFALEVGIPVGHVGIAAVPVPRPVGISFMP